MIGRVIVFSALLGGLVGTSLGVVHARQESRRLFVELTRLSNERDDLKFEFGRLQIEQATQAENNRIEQIARERLGMVSPSAAESVLIQRQPR
ncbi:MAG: cell division protein FtsL [Dokdonella sp.]